MDFIVGLPMTKQGHNAIYTFVDRLSKMCHFVATVDTLGAEEAAALYMSTVFRLHGLQKEIVSERDPRFVSSFWQETMRRLGVQLSMSTAFHPQSDGQTERTNRLVEDYLRHYVNAGQDNWDDLLPVAEYAHQSMPGHETAECQEAFEGVKYGLALTLQHWHSLDPTLPYELVADASGECLGAILLQKGRPIAFESRRMTPLLMRNYFTTALQAVRRTVHTRLAECGVVTLKVELPRWFRRS